MKIAHLVAQNIICGGAISMKLYNRTVLSDEVLYPLFVEAGRAVDARTDQVIVRVVHGRTRFHGMAVDFYSVNEAYLLGKRNWRNTKRKINTDGGMIKLWIPLHKWHRWYQDGTVRHKGDSGAQALLQAEAIYKLVAHEWKHIQQYQQRTFVPTPRDSAGRRITWAERPCEIAAEEAMYVAFNNLGDSAQEAILNVALKLENILIGEE